MKPSWRKSSAATVFLLSLGLVVFLGFRLRASEKDKPTPILEALTRSETVMYIGAHADDENSIAAFLARSAGAGKKTYIVCFTRGENEPMDVGVPKGHKMGEARSQWLRDSAALLGAEPIQLPYVNGPLSIEEMERGVLRYWPRDTRPEEVIAQWRKSDRDPYEDMIRIIREKKPDVILTWEKTQGWTGNAEHRVLGLLSEKAFHDAADTEVFPEQIHRGLQPWQPKWLFWVLRGEGDDFGPNPMEEIDCEAPGPGGKTTCEVKAAVLMSYKRHTVRDATPEQLAQMEKQAVKWVQSHPEHVQLVLEAEERKN